MIIIKLRTTTTAKGIIPNSAINGVLGQKNINIKKCCDEINPLLIDWKEGIAIEIKLKISKTNQTIYKIKRNSSDVLKKWNKNIIKLKELYELVQINRKNQISKRELKEWIGTAKSHNIVITK